MAIRIGEERSMLRERVARVRTAPTMRIGATNQSLLEELITGALPAMDLYIPNHHQISDMYATAPNPLIRAGDVYLGGGNNVPQGGEVPPQDVTGLGGSGDDLGYGNTICGNQGLMANTTMSENTSLIINMAEGEAYAGGDVAASYMGRGQWTSEEDRLLEKLVKKEGEKKWSKIANALPGRIGKQCRERWFNHVHPGVKKTSWTQEEELMLVDWHRKVGNKWALIAKHIPGRPENTIKNHWNATFRSQKAKRRSKKKEAAIASGARPTVLEDYMRYELNEAGASAGAAGSPAEHDDAGTFGWQAADPAVTAPSSRSNSPDRCWLNMLCGGMLPPAMMQGPEPLLDLNVESGAPPQDDGHYVFPVYQGDGYPRYAHLQLTPGHGYAPENQAAAYYNHLPFQYPFNMQPVDAHTTYPAGFYYQEAGPSYHGIGGGDGSGEAPGNAGFDTTISEQTGMPFSAKASGAQNQRGGGI